MTTRHGPFGDDRGRRLELLVVRLITTVAAAGLLAGCADDRPSSTEWAERWEAKQALVPTQAAMIDGGRSFCDQLVADLRTQLDDLEPTPSESIDPALESWSAHLRTLAFECPADPSIVADELATIDALGAEIETALAEP